MSLKASGYTWLLCVILAIVATFGDVGSVAARAHRSHGSRGTSAAQDELLAAALTALEAGRFAAAEQAFFRVYASEQRPELLFYLGRLASAKGNGLLARDLMRRYLQDPEREPNASQQELAQLLLDEPAPAGEWLGEVTITGPRGAWVRIDGQPMGVLPLLSAMQIPAGLHTVAMDSGSRRLSGEAWVTAGFATEARFNLDARTVFSSAPPPLLVLFSNGKGAAEASLANPLFAALQQAAKSAGLLLLTRADALRSAADLGSCLDALSCQQDLAIANEALGVLRIHIEPQSPVDSTGLGTWALHAQFVDVVAGQILSTVREICQSCRAPQLHELAAQAGLRSYHEAWSRSRGRLTVTLHPETARVRINGHRYPRAAVVVAPLAGAVYVEASAPGHGTVKRNVVVRENQATILELTLNLENEAMATNPPAEPGEHASPRSRALFWGGIAALGAGVILGGFGLSGLAVHGQCGAGSSTEPLCPQIYDTQSKGGALLGVGLGLSLVGTVGIVLGREAVRRKH